MKIAICDKDITFSYKLKHILYTYSNTHNLEFFVEIFNSGEQLLNSNNKYFLIFIEYSLSGINGLETAKEINKLNKDTEIIFLTADIDLIYKNIKTPNYHFLPQEPSTEKIFETFDQLFFSKQINYPLWIKDGFTTHCINTAEITYLEADNKYCYVHLNDGVIWCKKTMARVYEALPKSCFLKINRSFIVNISFINKYNTDSVFLKNGEDLHITRTYFKDFKKNYTIYSSPKII